MFQFGILFIPLCVLADLLFILNTIVLFMKLHVILSTNMNIVGIAIYPLM